MQDVLAARLVGTRRGALTVGIGAAVVAGLVLVVYLKQYRASVNSGSKAMTVLVAKRLIEKDTPGNLIGVKHLFQIATVPRSELKIGALADPGVLRGRVALADIYPGQQLTVADFTATTTEAIPTRISGSQRALSLPLDGAHGMIGQVATGNHVDVWAGFNTVNGVPVVGLVAPNVLVLSAPAAVGGGLGGGGGTGNIVLRVSPRESARLAYSSDNGHIWIVLRPQVGANPTKPAVVTIRNAVAGLRPVSPILSKNAPGR
jgi:Flp pilus assembly protein CpaB